MRAWRFSLSGERGQGELRGEDFQHPVDLRLVVQQARRQAHHRADIAIHGVADYPVRHQVFGDRLAIAAFDAEEGEARRQLGAGRRDQADLGMLAQALLEVGVELVDTRLDLGLAQLQVQLEGRAQGQAMFEGVVAARGHQGAEVVGAEKVGMLGTRCSWSCSERAMMTPVPRGPNSHLWVPAMK